MKRLATAVIFTCGLCVFTGMPLPAADIDLQIITRATEILPNKPWDEYPTIGQAVKENTPIQIRTYNEGGTEYFVMRGYNKGVQIYLDGVPLPQDMTGLTDVSFIPVAIIDRVEVIEGFNPASPQATGSVYIYTKKPIKGATVFDAAAYTGSNKTNMFSLGLRSDVLNLPYSINYTRNTSDGFQENSAYTKDSVNASFEPLKDQTFSYNFMRSHAGLPGGTPVPIGEWNGVREQQANSLTDFIINTAHQAAFNGRYGEFKYGAGYSNIKREGENWGPVLVRNNDYSIFTEYALSDYLTAGLSYSYSDIETDNSMGYYNKNYYKWNNYGVYANSFIPTKIVDFDLGARFDYNDLWEENFSYKAKASKGRATSVYISAESGKIFPSIADYDKHIAPLKPETSYQFETGVEGKYLDFSFKISPYVKFIDDKINLIEVPPGSWNYFAKNIGEARILGVDIQAAKTIGIYNANITYSLMDSRIKPYGTGSFLKAQFAPEQILRFNNSLKLGSWRAGGAVYAQSVQYTGNDKAGDRLPGYADIELSLEKKVAAATIFTTVSNVFDRHYAINGGFGTFYPCAGRTYKLGVKYLFSS